MQQAQVAPKQQEEKNLSTGAKVGISLVVATGIAIAADLIFAKGKHVKNILKLEEKEIKKGEQVGENLNKKPDEADDILKNSINKTEQKNTPNVEATQETQVKVDQETTSAQPKINATNQTEKTKTKETNKKQNEEIKDINEKSELNDPQNIIALGNYKCRYDQEINQGLRLGKAEPEIIDKINQLEALFTPVTENVTVYRGLKLRQNSPFAQRVKNLKVGDVLSDDAFLSTTSDVNIARTFKRGNGIVLNINIPKGTKILDVEKFRSNKIFMDNGGNTIRNEAEILLPRGTSLKITGIDPKTGVINAEYVTSTPKTISKVSITTPLERHQFNMEKIINYCDAYPTESLLAEINKCIEINRYADAKKILEILNDRAVATKDSVVFLTCVNPNNCPKSSVLRLFDKMNKNDEAIKYLDNIKLFCEKEGRPDTSSYQVTQIVKALEDQNCPLSDDMIKLLTEKGYLN